MEIDVLMPAIGAGTTQGKVLKWLKDPGDAVMVGDVLAEIETDKAVIELDAVDEGVLDRILVDAGDEEIPVGSVLAKLKLSHGAGECIDAVQSTGQVAASVSSGQEREQEASSTVAALRVFASPSARRLAREAGVELDGLKGSGPGGRIVRVDIERVAGQRQPVKPLVQAGEPHASHVGSLSPHTPMRRTIARRLVESKREIPHFYLRVQCRMDKLLEARSSLNARSDRHYSLNDLLVLAAARALHRVPELNVRWHEDGVQQHAQVDISVAVALDRGLITPVLFDVGTAGLRLISTRLADLVVRAREGRLRPEQYEGGCLTVSNLGMFGVQEFSAIINPPQSAILAAGSVVRQPVVEGDELRIGSVMTLTLSADHRVIDGSIGARYLTAVRSLLENPVDLIL